MEKVLVVSHVGRHLRLFGRADIKVLQSMGYEVHFASNFNLDIDKVEDSTVILHQVDFSRSPTSLSNFKALIQVIKLLKREKYTLMHCQYPTGGVVSRIAAKIVGFKPVIYMAHGFPFSNEIFNMKNFLIKIIELICARWTDYLITINDADYQVAKKFKIRKGGQVFKTHGVGIDLNRFRLCTIGEKASLRLKLGIRDDAFVFVCVGELIERKNQEQIIRAFKKFTETEENSLLLIVGVGELWGKYHLLVEELNIRENVRLTGYRRDICDLLCAADVAISASRSEGMPVNVMEAMATGTPVIVTNCRGNVDLIENNITGLVVEINNIIEMAEAMLRIFNNQNLADKMKQNSLMKINSYSVENAKLVMQNCYMVVTRK